MLELIFAKVYAGNFEADCLPLWYIVSVYETEDKINKELENITYNKMPITLEEFLSTAEFDLDNFSANCQKYKENSLYLEIIASNVNTEDIYKIPLTIKDNCKS